MKIPDNARVCIIANQHAGQAQGLSEAIDRRTASHPTEAEGLEPGQG